MDTAPVRVLNVVGTAPRWGKGFTYYVTPPSPPFKVGDRIVRKGKVRTIKSVETGIVYQAVVLKGWR